MAKKKKIIGVAIAIVLVVACALALLFFWNKNTESDTNNGIKQEAGTDGAMTYSYDPTDTNNGIKQEAGTADDGNGIELEAKIADDGNSIELNIINNSSGTIMCSLDCEIQVRHGTAWEKCATEKAIDGVGVEISPNGSYLQNISLDHPNISSGETYRIKKVIGEHECYSNEFAVE